VVICQTITEPQLRKTEIRIKHEDSGFLKSALMDTLNFLLLCHEKLVVHDFIIMANDALALAINGDVGRKEKLVGENGIFFPFYFLLTKLLLHRDEDQIDGVYFSYDEALKIVKPGHAVIPTMILESLVSKFIVI